jgi:hypothetical protein
MSILLSTSTREALLRGRISTVDLLVLTSLDHVLFKLKLHFSFFTKQPILMRLRLFVLPASTNT